MSGMGGMDGDSMQTCMSNSNAGRICHINFDAVPQVVGEPAATNVFAAFDDANGNILGNWVHCSKTSGPDSHGTTSWVCMVNPCPQPLHPIMSLDVRATS